MAKQSGIGDRLYVQGVDLSGDINSLSKISGSVATIDVTDITQSATSRLGGLRSGEIDFTALFDTATAHPALKALPRTDVQLMYLRGTALQNAAACMVSKQINYDGTRGNDGSFTFAVQAMSNAFGLEWGENLTGSASTGIRTDTTATVGSAITDLAATSFGGQAYFQCFGVTGTSVTIDIQSATTSGGSYTTTGLTSTAFTTVGAQRLSISNATTINQYLKVVTTGTFTQAKFAVVFVRNPIAAQVF